MAHRTPDAEGDRRLAGGQYRAVASTRSPTSASCTRSRCKPIADGDAAQGIKGLDPIQTGQLTREQIAEAEDDPDTA